MKLLWPFVPFVGSLLCSREQGVDAVRTLYGQGGEGQVVVDVFYGQSLVKLYTAKNVLLTRISL